MPFVGRQFRPLARKKCGTSSTGRTGWDGQVETRKLDAFVPEGTSGWELGCGADFKKKAEEDFKSRTKNSSGFDKSETTFIFVTPRKWQDKGKWCQAKRKLGIWKDVRVYDSATIEEWLKARWLWMYGWRETLDCDMVG